MHLRLMANMLLRHGDSLLLLRRGSHKKIAPGMWAPCGGHVEPCEMNNPLQTALREMREETGIAEGQLASLSLRYILMNTGGGELRVQTTFLGILAERVEPSACDEGIFCWIPFAEMADIPAGPSIRAMLDHYVCNPDDERIHTCVLTAEPPSVNWTHQIQDAVAL